MGADPPSLLKGRLPFKAGGLSQKQCIVRCSLSVLRNNYLFDNAF